MSRTAKRPRGGYSWKDSTHTWVNKSAHPEVVKQEEATNLDGFLVFRIEGPIFYANVERLYEWLEEEEMASVDKGTPLKAIILKASTVPFVDTTAIQVLMTLIEAYKARGVVFLIAEAFGQAGRMFEQCLSGTLPPESLEKFLALGDAVELAQRMVIQSTRRVSRRSIRPSVSVVVDAAGLELRQ